MTQAPETTTPRTAPRLPAKNYLRQARLVIGLAVFFGALLASVEIFLGPVIAANKENETLEVVPLIVAGAARDHITRLTVPDSLGEERVVYRARASDGALKGWVAVAKGQGFVDQIELLIGLDPGASKITGIFVLSQKETPNLGDNISSGPRFTDQFQGKPTAMPLTVVKKAPSENHDIQAITGATISSESVVAIVNRAVSRLRSPLRERPSSATAPHSTPEIGR